MFDDLLRRVANFWRSRAHVGGAVSIGKRFHLGPGSVVWSAHGLQIGADVYVGKNVTIEVDGEIGGGTLIANNVGIIGRRDHDHHEVGTPIRHARWIGDDRALSDPVSIGHDVWVGFGVVILSGVRIGNSVVIASGSVVTKDIPSNCIAVGRPAEAIAARFKPDDWTVHDLRMEEIFG